MNSEKEIYRPSIEKEKDELSVVEKRQLVDVWHKIVLGKEYYAQNIETMTTEEIRKWLYVSLTQEIELLAKDWNLEPDEELVGKIQREQDLENKAKWEVEYIKDVHGKVSGIAENFDMASADVHWSSWPARMKETKKFNCVMASFLGMNFLKKAGIKSYFGNPVGHIADVAQLSNRDWQYVDFLVKNLTKRINPSEIKLGNTQVLKIDDDDIGFRMIPLIKDFDVLSSIFNNLSLLKKEIINKNMPQETVEYISKFQVQFNEVDFGGLSKKLCSDIYALMETKEMKEEFERKNTARLKSSNL